MTEKLEAISMEPVKEKLRNLKDYIPKGDDFLYGFARYLADRLNPELVPMGFNLACELAIEDLKRGGDYGEDGKMDVPSSLIGYPPMMYGLLRMRIPEITKATCPSEFAEEVNKVYEEVNTKIRGDK